MILVQVLDLAAKTCGEPHVAPSWEIAKASLGAMLAKTPELAERASSIQIERVADWDPTCGVKLTDMDYPYMFASGSTCLTEFQEACKFEENAHTEEADNAE